MSTAFDRALEYRELMAAAEARALLHGEFGGPAYRVAYLRFLRADRTTQDPGPGPAPADVSGAAVTVLKAAIERAMRIDEAPMANAQLYDAGSGSLRLIAHSGFTPGFIEFFETVEGTRSACGSALATGHPVWMADVTRSPVFAGTAGLDVMLEADARAVASLPVRSPDGGLLGMISAHHERRTRWTRERRRGLEHLTRSTGRVLDHVLRHGLTEMTPKAIGPSAST